MSDDKSEREPGLDPCATCGKLKGHDETAHRLAPVIEQLRRDLANEREAHRELRGAVSAYSRDICTALEIKDGGITHDRDPVKAIERLRELEQLATDLAEAMPDPTAGCCTTCGVDAGVLWDLRLAVRAGPGEAVEGRFSDSRVDTLPAPAEPGGSHCHAPDCGVDGCSCNCDACAAVLASEVHRG